MPNSGPDSADYPYGYIIDETDEVAGTPVIEATYSDFIQSLNQFLRVTSTTPNGLKENTTNGFQLFDAIEKFLCPVGSIKIWPSNTFPSGWVVCNGAYVNKASDPYPDLFTVIGNTYGSGTSDGSHHDGTGALIPGGVSYYLLPKLSDRMPLGKGTTYPTIAATGGEITHLLTSAEMPAHRHNNGVASHATVNQVYSFTTEDMPGSAVHSIVTDTNARTYQGLTSQEGGGTAHNNMPPYLVINFIIKAKYGKNL